MLRFSVLDPNNKSAAEMYAEIDSLTNQDFQQILAEFRQNIKADILVVGNVTPKVGSIKTELTIMVIYANMLTIQVVIHMCMLWNDKKKKIYIYIIKREFTCTGVHIVLYMSLFRKVLKLWNEFHCFVGQSE